MSQLLARASIALAVIFLIFVIGSASEYFQALRIPALHNAFTSLEELIKVWSKDENSRDYLIRPRYTDEGVTNYDKSRAYSGINLVTGVWQKNGEWVPTILLMDMEGNKLHEWEAVFEDLWSESPYEEEIIERSENYVHGAVLMPNGDVVFNIEYMGLFRIDSCSNEVWKVPYRTHHSVYRDEYGDFWAPGFRKHNEQVPRFFSVRPYFGEDSAVHVSADGEILDNISILDAIYSSGYYEIFANKRKTRDITHMNDVEVLSESLAADFPMFAAGDIMVSLRNISTVMIIDRETHKVKWHFQFPLLNQHDADFEPGGFITIYNNRDDSTDDGRYLKQSQIIRVDPNDNSYDLIYPFSEEAEFYSKTAGKHSVLPNGNRLIVEPRAARAFEVAPDGDLVWNWVADIQENGMQSEIMQVTRLPGDYIDLGELKKDCSVP